MICNVNVIHSNTCDLSAYLFLYNVTNLCQRRTPSSSCCCCPPDFFSAIVQIHHSPSHLLRELISASLYYSYTPLARNVSLTCVASRQSVCLLRKIEPHFRPLLFCDSSLHFSLFLCLNILRSCGCDVVSSSFTQFLADHKQRSLQMLSQSAGRTARNRHKVSKCAFLNDFRILGFRFRFQNGTWFSVPIPTNDWLN